MADIATLQPCPFCGSQVVSIVGPVVRCGGCGAAGPYGNSADDTAHRWNGRTKLAGSADGAAGEIAPGQGRDAAAPPAPTNP